MKRAIILALMAVSISFALTSCKGINTRIHPKSDDPWLAIPKAGEKVSLCEQELTTLDYIQSRYSEEGDSTWVEVNPCEDAFLYLDKSLEDDPTAQTVRLRYNYESVINRINDCYEKYDRITTADSVSREDTLFGISFSKLAMEESILPELILDKGALLQARNIVNVWSTFDGNVAGGSSYNNAIRDFRNYYDKLPPIVSEEDLNNFQKHFWKWYDKKKYVDNINDIIALRYKSEDYKISDTTLSHICEVIESEPEINRRTVLALELSRFDSKSALLYLGEILESGQYTKYLLETWLEWRASVQFNEISPSSFSTIPNNYYDMMRARCINTMLKHYNETGDKYDLCMIENFIQCEVLHRMGSLTGNESCVTLFSMSNGMFVDPKVIDKYYIIVH